MCEKFFTCMLNLSQQEYLEARQLLILIHSPVRTFNTAVMYYHRFRLVHPDNEYNFTVCAIITPLGSFQDLCLTPVQDAAAAALFTACKIEDTLKKSREIVCAAYNLKLSPSEYLTPDDPVRL